MAPPRPVHERFMEKVSFWHGGTECWQWMAAKNQYGYGQINVGKRKRVAAHRWSYETFVGPLSATDCVLHSCDNPACVNPAHLSVGDRAANAADMVARGRSSRGERRWNTSLTEDDVRAIRADKRRQCDIAAEYGVRQGTISRIRSGARWRHVA